jgi:hypothetical protein
MARKKRMNRKKRAIRKIDFKTLLDRNLISPSNEFTVIPFWFWNDSLNQKEILRQIADFDQHGVSGFVIHPRVGLPRDQGWMSENLLDFYQIAIDEAKRRGMLVTLYDEGMYPSGSSCGQVVAEDPAYACRGLGLRKVIDGIPEPLSTNENLVAVVSRKCGTRIAVIDRPTAGYIRGIHYIDEGPAEDRPPAADILNPNAVAAFIRLVYDRFAQRFGEEFGKTIVSIFTDEPALLGKCRDHAIMPGTAGILEHVNRILGYDFTPHLPTLWFDDEPDAVHFRADYMRAVNIRLQETYYRPLQEWCSRHGVSLTGHPHRPDDMGALRWFHIPGQDLVWRKVLPDHPSALEGAESTQAKCSSSIMLHYGRRRNASECYGAYGHELSWDEMLWLAQWAFIRGVNLLYPHAFYYSVRGIRHDERPPDVGPNSSWWNRYGDYSLLCRRLSWLNTDSTHECSLVILGDQDGLPWRAAKVCFEHQRDFNYLAPVDILKRAEIDEMGIHIAGMSYRALIVENEPSRKVMAKLAPLLLSGRVICYRDGMPELDLIRKLNELDIGDIQVLPPTKALRIRHVIKENCHYYILFNEEKVSVNVEVDFAAAGERFLFNPYSGETTLLGEKYSLQLSSHETKVLVIKNGVGA